ncbi:LON peptidase substrate-binding domain-containing protein [Shewanella olleyana]|uniref:LON peptidase substrate-binding domain-containing protein n=1 Tax=Shewanella olleyana TaxID=135626 RepID=UPI00200EF3B1|nr:LON peptidase substrate-binding domain-containing protein [Shewanella olleyana]MCL1067903.1 LON peptidase substrate-binding domain-containing protein [Shewanella olleyana]
MILPLFPLSICLLPQGFTQLRIFEPRYKRLVTESLKSGEGFGLCMLNSQNELMPIGTWVHIIDFEMLEDGLLGISIEGQHRFKVNSFEVEPDGLKRGDVSIIPDWPSRDLVDNQQYLSESLLQILEQYPTHLSHYNKQDFDNISWVCQRWLEIMPITAEEKYQCINSHNHEMTQELISSIIK